MEKHIASIISGIYEAIIRSFTLEVMAMIEEKNLIGFIKVDLR